ncbi:Rv3654c family TadE-like protein [Microbacterium paraoxydans]|uniref:Helicase n=1 Tax=Microbacterium paraoxydans TaxID=199592 RepID=A0ABS5IN47_9MICO|nr:Rv3654c family TadE-like protein [Microbacterium paraoxydans]MBS0024376.1 helicase [Microbacterium paraoxydans]
MAGTVLAAGVLVVGATLAVGLVAVGGAAVTTQRTAAAADAAALAAADARSGAVPTSQTPCALAAHVAQAGGARLVRCSLAGDVATVTVSAAYAGLAAVSRARAGQPEEP